MLPSPPKGYPFTPPSQVQEPWQSLGRLSLPGDGLQVTGLKPFKRKAAPARAGHFRVKPFGQTKLFEKGKMAFRCENNSSTSFQATVGAPEVPAFPGSLG